MADPPFTEGALQLTTDWPLAAPVALTAVGALGTVEGTMALEALEATEVPEMLVAVTVKV